MTHPDKFDIIFKALADPNRRRILDMLKEQPLTTGQLCDHFEKLDRCTVMMHIKILEKAELIIPQRKGRHRWNYLNVLPIKEISDRWIDKFAVNAVDLLSQMKRDLEAEPGGEKVQDTGGSS